MGLPMPRSGAGPGRGRAASTAVVALAVAACGRLAFVALPSLCQSEGRGAGCMLRRPLSRGRTCRRLFERPAERYENDNYAKWDPKNRKRRGTYQEAERILTQTGRLPRPLRLKDVRANSPPMKKSIVANAKERRRAAEMAAVYAVTRLQARLLLRRDYHAVWGHERIMVYGSMVADYLQPDANTNEPFEKNLKLKFKAAFREDFDPFFPTQETYWQERLEGQGLRPDLREGKVIEKALKEQNPEYDVPENMFCEAILDNVIDLGELVLQHFACHVDRESTSNEGKKHRLNKRMQRRLTKTLGVKTQCEVKEPDGSEELQPVTPQELHDATAGFEDWRLKSFFKWKDPPKGG